MAAVAGRVKARERALTQTSEDQPCLLGVLSPLGQEGCLASGAESRKH